MEEHIIYYNGGHTIYELGKRDIERFISMYLFPMAITPPLAILYLKEKHALIINSISDYILKNTVTKADSPITRDELYEIIFKALKVYEINIGEIRAYDEQEVLDWKDSYLNNNGVTR